MSDLTQRLPWRCGKLVGNPNPVPDEFGDESFGFDATDEEEYRVKCIEKAENYPGLKEDVDKIVEIYKQAGYSVEPASAMYAWSEFSQAQQADWLEIYDENVIENTIKYLIEKES